MKGVLLPTSLVGSYAQPDWLIDRKKLAGHALLTHVRFSNRPVRVKRFQAIHYCGVGTTRGLALLFGIGAKALPAWDFFDPKQMFIAH